MCYPKPGPRCSAHAATTVAKLRKKVFVISEAPDIDGVPYYKTDAYKRAMNSLKNAQKEYDITPAGIRAAERALMKRPDDQTQALTLDTLKKLRAARIAAVGAQAEKTHNFTNKIKNIKYPHSHLSENGAILDEVKQKDPIIDVMIADSEAWSHRLTTDEIQTVRWYTQDGYADLNGYVSDPDYKGKSYTKYKGSAEDKKELNTRVAEMDSAIDKSDLDRDVVVYRRHFFYSPEGDYLSPDLDDVQSRFTPGDTYEPGFYMSTSLNPDNGPMSDGGVAFLEIKARKAASVSAIANSGTSEQEYLLPRTGKYKVVANDKKIKVRNDTGEMRELTIIQLEEIG